MDAAQVLHILQMKSPNSRWAFLQADDKVYFAGEAAYGPHPSSALVKLLQGLFDEHKDLSFFLLRKRIYLNYEPGPMDRGFIDLVAKRFSVLSASEVSAEGTPAPTLIEIGQHDDTYFISKLPPTPLKSTTTEIKSDEEAVAYLGFLEAQVQRGDVMHDHARPIAAVLCTAEGKVLGEALHSGAINKTRHAEIDLIQKLFREGFKPQEGQTYNLYVSLTPCRMCAGAWAEMFREGLQVFVKDVDLGPKAQGTELEKRGLIRSLRVHR